MAQLCPTLTTARHDLGLYRELAVLNALELSLPDGYQIFHSVQWQAFHDEHDRHGEIDLVVLSPNGNILLIEVKAGEVTIENGVMTKHYKDNHTGQNKDVSRQLNVQHAAMVGRLKRANLFAFVTHCLVLPDHKLGQDHIIALDPERIIDATEFPHLGRRVQNILNTVRYDAAQQSDTESLRRFLANEFNVSLDLQVLGQHLQSVSKRLADGLATWVPRIHAPSGVLRIQGTAGSGKTQLALRLLNDVASAATSPSQRALYVCFNRTLADHIGRVAPVRAKVTSFHELCVEHLRRTVSEPDFTQAHFFQTAAEHYCTEADTLESVYDLIVIDEGQDFEPDWVGALLPQLKENGRLYLLEDESQRIYARDPFDLSEAVTITCHDNFRSPYMLCALINALKLTEHPIKALNPFAGELPGFSIYTESDSDQAPKHKASAPQNDLLTQTARAVQVLIDKGIALEQIVVLSGRGHTKSALLKADKIGEWSTRRFTGQYNKNSEPLWTEGQLTVESIYRYKGQSAAGIVLSEWDIAATQESDFSEAEKRKLFVGLTRAQLHCEMVMTERTDALLKGMI